MSARRAMQLVLVPFLLGVTATCAQPMTEGSRMALGQEGPSADVTVRNEASTGAHVYALQNGHMVPVAFVDPGAEETVSLPPVFVQSGDPLRLVVDPLESTEHHQSDPVTVDSGSRITFTIRDDLDASTVSVEG